MIQRQIITPQVQKLLSRVNPDTLTNVDDSHAFLYTRATGLLVDPDTCRTHAAWSNEDPDIEEIFRGGSIQDQIGGRYCEYWNIPVVAFWQFKTNGHLTQPAARSLLRVLPSGTVAVVDKGEVWHDAVLLTDLAKAAPNPKHRGHQYWQLRQTSESVVHEALLPIHQTLDSDLHGILDKLTPDYLSWMNVTPTGFIYTEDGELIEFPDTEGHEEYILNYRPDLIDHYGKEWYNHCVAARFVPLEVNNYHSKYNGRTINILSVWAYTKENGPVLYLLTPALRAMASRIPADTYVTCGAGRFGAFAPFHISTLTGHSAARGHRYWQLRQTSESRL